MIIGVSLLNTNREETGFPEREDVREMEDREWDAAQAAWKQFEQSGAIRDYLRYCRVMEAGRMANDADQNAGAGAQTAEYRGE